MSKENRHFIGLVGTNGSGKTAICNYLHSKLHFAVYSLSDIVREEARNRRLELTRDNLVKTGTLIKSLLGENILAKQAYHKAIQEKNNFSVFDSIRHISEVKFFKKKNVLMIGIDAPIEIRYKRIKDRKRETDNIDFATFKEHDDRENLGKSKGQNILEALAECPIKIQNSESLENLYNQINNIIEQH